MRADKDFKTYEQALTVVQRFGEMAEAEYKKGKHKEANYNLSHATFVGVKHLLFMAADAAIDRAEARELAAKNHLATMELLSLTLADLTKGGVGNGSDDATPHAGSSKGQRRAIDANGKAIKVAKVAIGAGDVAPGLSRKIPNTPAPGKRGGPRERRR